MSFARPLVLSLALLAATSAALAQRSTSGRVGAVPESSSRGRLNVAPNASSWQAGPLQNTYGPDCLDLNGGFLYGYIVTGWVAYYGDPNSTPPVPKAGDVYYTYVFAQNSATCTSASVQPFLIPPTDTTLAISVANPVRCYKNGQPWAGAPCTQNPPLSTSLSGATGYYLGLWSNLNGGSVEIQVPVTSTTSGAKTLYARIDTAGGGNGWITPSVSYLVGTNTVTPTVSYPATPTTMITDTTAKTTADVYNQFQAGTFYFDIGTTTSYGTSSSGNAVSGSGNGFQYYADWSGLSPGTLYHWRGRFTYAGGTIYGADQTFTTTGTLPEVPTYVNATPLSPTQVGITWEPAAGATSYQVWRRGPTVGSSYAQIGTTATTTYTDSTVAANSSYQYRVRAVTAAGSSPDSQYDLTTTVMYSDDRLVEYVTPIKANHLIELRTAVNALRTLAGLGAGVYTDTAVPGLTVKAIHIQELRTQYDQALGAITGFNQSWATNPVVGGPITFVDFQQLRDRLK